MQKFKFLRQPLLGELAISQKREEREKNAIYSGHLRLCQQPRAAHALRSDQLVTQSTLRLFQQIFCVYSVSMFAKGKLTQIGY